MEAVWNPSSFSLENWEKNGSGACFLRPRCVANFLRKGIILRKFQDEQTQK